MSGLVDYLEVLLAAAGVDRSNLDGWSDEE
jgi:hypothetical protein